MGLVIEYPLEYLLIDYFKKILIQLLEKKKLK